MASKFFTWSKGDRRPANDAIHASGVVPIPVECLTFRGLEFTKPTKVCTASFVVQPGMDIRPPSAARMFRSNSRAQNGKKDNLIPSPLNITSPSTLGPTAHGLSPNATFLHDAYMESATNLLTAVNDILRTPHLSSHSTNSVQLKLPMHGRPRSHTAPPTPVVEAATYLEPVELSASTTIDLDERAKSRDSLQGLRPPPLSILSNQEKAGLALERPHSSPTAGSPTWDLRHRSISDTRLGVEGSLLSPLTASARYQHNSSRLQSALRTPNSSIERRPTALERERLSIMDRKTARPSFSPLQPRDMPKPADSRAESDEATPLAKSNPQSSPYPDRRYLAKASLSPIAQEDSKRDPKSQFAALQASHECYIRSLNQAHAREISSLRTYINLLEHHKSPTQEKPLREYEFPHKNRIAEQCIVSSKSYLSLDTSQTSTKVGELLSADASATTTSSFESALEKQKRLSQETAEELEALKRQLSLTRRREVEAQDVRSERDKLWQSLADTERKAVQLQNMLSRTKEDEKALKNKVESLEARLEAANTQRIDALEGYRDAREKSRRSYERECILTREIEELRKRPTQLELDHLAARLHEAEERARFLQGQVNMTPDSAGFAPFVTGFQEQLHRIQDDRDAKSARVVELERENEALRHYRTLKPDSKQQSDIGAYAELEGDLKRSELPAGMQSPMEVIKVDSPVVHTAVNLQQQLLQQEKSIAALQAERDKYSSLLRSELRRQARLSAGQHNANPSPLRTKQDIDAAIAAVEGRVAESLRNVPEDVSANSTERERITAVLEQEITHLVEEIVMYKLDIKGYRKDLKKANATIERLQSASPEPSLPPYQLSALRYNDPNAATEQRIPGFEQLVPPSGLGITFNFDPRDSHTAIAHATSTALISTTPPTQLSAFPPIPPSKSAPPSAHPPHHQKAASTATASTYSPPSAHLSHHQKAASTSTTTTYSSSSQRPKTPLSTHKKLPKPPHIRTPAPSPDVSGTGQLTPVPPSRKETGRSVSESIISSYAKREEPPVVTGNGGEKGVNRESVARPWYERA